jgi:GTP-binding protein LepA
VLNKIDLPGAMIEEIKDQIVDLIACDHEDIICASAKEGIGIDEILDAIVKRIPAPKGDPNAPLKAIIFDSVYNPFKGIEVYFRIFDGTVKAGDKVQFVNTKKSYEINELGILKLKAQTCDCLSAGNVGYIVSGIKKATEVKVGDTITHIDRPCLDIIKGFENVKPMVFAGVYPVDTNDYEELKEDLEKLQLNDASLVYTYESSVALGIGFRCGFLGMLHMEIVQERLEREFGISVITTAPSVHFKIFLQNGEMQIINTPAHFPDPGTIKEIQEPMILTHIITKPEYLGNIISLCMGKRGIVGSQTYLSKDRVEISFKMPLAEIVFDFFDKLKTISRGYASMDYEVIGYEPSDMIKLDILLNGEKVDALSTIIHRSKAYEMGRKLCDKLKELLPRQLFEIPIQASIGNKIIARETVKAMRKNVIAKCYGGDVSRKRKLLEKQKKGKKRMRQIGSVEVPQEAFLAILKV